MSEQETRSEALGRRAGEAIGAQLGGLAGRAVGELLATGLAGVGVTTGSADGAATEPTANDRDDDSEQGAAEEGSEPTAGSGDSEASDEDEEAKRPSSRAELEAMSYRELQQLAKAVDVTANLAREEMEDRLVETLDLDG